MLSFENKQKFRLQLVSFKKFKDVGDALKATTSIADESKIGKTLKSLLKKTVTEGEELAVGDKNLGSIIKVSTFVFDWFLEEIRGFSSWIELF